MNKEIIFSMNTAFRGEFNIHGYSYGRGDKAACIVGSMRGLSLIHISEPTRP